MSDLSKSKTPENQTIPSIAFLMHQNDFELEGVTGQSLLNNIYRESIVFLLSYDKENSGFDKNFLKKFQETIQHADMYFANNARLLDNLEDNQLAPVAYSLISWGHILCPKIEIKSFDLSKHTAQSTESLNFEGKVIFAFNEYILPLLEE